MGTGRSDRGEAASSSGSGEFEEDKIFVGALPASVDDAAIRRHFGQFGTIVQGHVSMDKTTGRSKGFVFIKYSEPDVVQKVLGLQHELDGRTVDVKPVKKNFKQSAGSAPRGRPGERMGAGGSGAGGQGFNARGPGMNGFVDLVGMGDGGGLSGMDNAMLGGLDQSMYRPGPLDGGVAGNGAGFGGMPAGMPYGGMADSMSLGAGRVGGFGPETSRSHPRFSPY